MRAFYKSRARFTTVSRQENFQKNCYVSCKFINHFTRRTSNLTSVVNQIVLLYKFCIYHTKWFVWSIRRKTRRSAFRIGSKKLQIYAAMPQVGIAARAYIWRAFSSIFDLLYKNHPKSAKWRSNPAITLFCRVWMEFANMNWLMNQVFGMDPKLVLTCFGSQNNPFGSREDLDPSHESQFFLVLTCKIIKLSPSCGNMFFIQSFLFLRLFHWGDF